MSTYIERKKFKKTKKYSNILFKDFKVKVSEVPQPNLAICNAGLLTGISEEDVVNNFSPYGLLEKVVMIPNKSYCFISYRKINSAVECFSSTNFPKETPLVKNSLHLLYVEDIPPRQDLYQNYSYIPPGVIIIENFISEAEESALTKLFDLNNDHSQELSHRKVKHFGYEFQYGSNNVNKSSPLAEGIPNEFNFLHERICEKNLRDLIPWNPDQLTINCYLPGQGIPPHVDTHSAFEDPILSLSMLSDVIMEFEKCDKQMKASVLLSRRSLLIISGEGRYFWTHGIIPRKSDVIYSTSNGFSTKPREKRISCTFRKIRIGECHCKYNLACDSYLKVNPQTLSNSTAERIENEFVHKVYENISDHFSLTRHSAWPGIRDFLVSLPNGSIVVDIGCGNGKYFNLNKNSFHFGGDSCNRLNSICRDKGMEVIQFNCLNVPIRDCVADAVICIAVIHHLFKECRRSQALREIYRILKVGGIALIYVWSKEQKSTNYVRKEISHISDKLPSLTNYTDESGIILPIHSNKTEFQHVDVLVPWNVRMKNKEASQYLRYYHLFEEEELKNMCLDIGADIIKSYYDDGNWCVMFRKSS